MPTTSVPKTKGTRMHLIIFRKRFETTFSSWEPSGKAQPMKTPTTIEIRIQWVRLMRFRKPPISVRRYRASETHSNHFLYPETRRARLVAPPALNGVAMSSSPLQSHSHEGEHDNDLRTNSRKGGVRIQTNACTESLCPRAGPAQDRTTASAANRPSRRPSQPLPPRPMSRLPGHS